MAERNGTFEKVMAELSALYEISSMSLVEDLDELLERAKEKAIRLFGLSHYALLLRLPDRGEVVCRWGFKEVGEIWRYLQEAGGSRAFLFPLKRNGVSGQLIMGREKPLEPEHLRIFHVFAHYLENSLGVILSLQGYKKSQERLRRERRLTRSIVATIPDCLLVLGPDLKVKEVNRSFFYTFGKEPKEVVGRDLRDVLGEGMELLEALLGEKRTWVERDVALRTPRGVRTFKMILRRMIVAEEEEEEEEEELLVLRDITEEKENQKALARYQELLRQAFMGTAEALSRVIEQRDPYTSGHCAGVARLARCIGEEMGLSEDTRTGLYIAGILHDIGKIAVPTEILVKPGKLNDLEMDMIKAHPRAGYQILKDIAFPWPVALVALQHHERLDGSGYPQGLKGEEIVLGARIVAVADVVDAMTHNRP